MVGPRTRLWVERGFAALVSHVVSRGVEQMHLDLRMLRALVVVEQSGTITDAARLLRFSAPAVSSHLQALERACGARLVRREGAGLRLTEEGRRAVPIARLILAAADELGDVGRPGSGPRLPGRGDPRQGHRPEA